MELFPLIPLLLVLKGVESATLLANGFQPGVTVEGEIPITGLPNFENFATPFNFYGTDMVNIEFNPNGVVSLRPDANLMSVPNPGSRSGTEIIIAPLHVDDLNAALGPGDPPLQTYTYRQRDCSAATATANQFTFLDCEMVDDLLAKDLQINPLTNPNKADHLFIGTWNLFSGAGLVQMVLVTLADGETLVLFLYEDSLASVTPTSDVFIGLQDGSGKVVEACFGGTAVTAATVGQLVTFSNKECLLPGQVLVNVNEVNGYCRRVSDTSWEVNVKVPYVDRTAYTTVLAGGKSADITACGGSSGTPFQTVTLTFDPTSSAETTDCGISISGTVVTVTVRFFQEEGYAQYRDLDVPLTCDVDDIPATVTPESVTVGDVGEKEEISAGRSAELQVVTGPGVGPLELTTACALGAPLTLQLKLSRDAADDLMVAPYGVFGTKCTFYNYDPRLSPVPTTGVNADGSSNSLPITPQLSTVIENSCPAASPGDMFYVTSGFVHVTGTGGAGDVDYYMQTSTFRCQGYPNTDLVWVTCDVDYCSTPYGNTAYCDDACVAASAKRRKRSVSGGSDVLTTSFAVRRSLEDAQPTTECIDKTVALATIVGLIVCLLLATGTAAFGFVMMFSRSRPSQTLMKN